MFNIMPTVYWVMQPAPSDPAQAIRQLSQAEWASYAKLKTEKRRADWLAGRWAAKHLLQAVIRQDRARLLPLKRISIVSDPDGVPIAAIHGAYPFDFSLSISHSHGYAFCAAAQESPWALGADIERIEPRSSAFCKDYFTDVEQQQVACTDQRDLLVTAIWSAKEAALKALHLGLSVDTRAITCRFDAAETIATRRSVVPTQVCIGSVVGSDSVWQPFEISLDQLRLHGRGDCVRLQGWWQAWQDFVLTLVVQTENYAFMDAFAEPVCTRRR